MDTIRVKGFFDELEKIALFGLGKKKPNEAAVFAAGAQREVMGFNRDAAQRGAKVRARFDPKRAMVIMTEGDRVVARHNVLPGGKNPNDPAVVFQKIAQVKDDRKITKERFQRFLRAAAAGAAGAGLGYGTGKLIGKPLEQKLVQYGMKVGPAKVLRYLVPTLGGLGAASMLARSRGTNELFRKIQGDNRNLNSPG